MSATFPIQAGNDESGRAVPAGEIPWWLAEEACAHYRTLYGAQTLEEVARRGGFGPAELLWLLRRCPL